ncbi:MAG: xly, partial [Phycisphaerales bacterium]|nr:xly [Phycisphaerales bacterium]
MTVRRPTFTRLLAVALATAALPSAVRAAAAPTSAKPAAPAPKPDPAGVEFFERKIRPVLAENCYACHSAKAEKVKGGLLLDSRAGLLKGGESGPAVFPGNPGKSPLVKAVRWEDPDTKMPPKTQLSAAAVADLTRWVQMGALWPIEPAPAGGGAVAGGAAG